MVQIIAGKMGKGKTKFLLEKANVAVKECKGSLVYLDKNTKNMHELDNKVRLINVYDYPIRSYNAFIGFLCGIISQDYDLEYLFSTLLMRSFSNRSFSCSSFSPTFSGGW